MHGELLSAERWPAQYNKKPANIPDSVARAALPAILAPIPSLARVHGPRLRGSVPPARAARRRSPSTPLRQIWNLHCGAGFRCTLEESGPQKELFFYAETSEECDRRPARRLPRRTTAHTLLLLLRRRPAPRARAGG